MLKIVIKSSLGLLACSSFLLIPITAMAQRVDYRDPSLKNRIPSSANNSSSQGSNSNIPAIPTPAGTTSTTSGQQINPQLASVLLAYGLQPAPTCLPNTVVIFAQLGGQITQMCAYPNANFQPGYYALDTNFKIAPINNPQQSTQPLAVPVMSGR